MRYLKYAAVLLVFVDSTAHAGPKEDAVAAYKAGKFAEAARIMRALAERGDASAQVDLAFLYSNGRGVPKDEVEAAKWYRKAAEQGDARGQYGFGLCYANGWGIPKDEVEAAKWFRKAAEQGYSEAQNYLGVMYANGRGVPKDNDEAAKWLRKAAVQGHQDARENLRQVEDQTVAAASSNLYGAIAYDRTTKRAGWSHNYRSQESADKAAIIECQKGASSCKIVGRFWGGWCGAYATGVRVADGWGDGQTREEAEQRAIARCGGRGAGCEVWAWSCNSSPPSGPECYAGGVPGFLMNGICHPLRFPIPDSNVMH